MSLGRQATWFCGSLKVDSELPRSRRKRELGSILRFGEPMKYLNPLFMRSQLSIRSLMDKFGEEPTHSNTLVLIHTINKHLLTSHLCKPSCCCWVFDTKSNFPALLVWTSHIRWQAGRDTITVKHEGASVEICKASTEAPGARLIFWALYNWGSTHGQDRDFNERHSSKRSFWWPIMKAGAEMRNNYTS